MPNFGRWKDLKQVSTYCRSVPVRDNLHLPRKRRISRNVGLGEDARTVNHVILLSTPNAAPIAVLIILPLGSRLQAHFTDDDSTRDITDISANLIVDYLLRGGQREAIPDSDSVQIATIELNDGDMNAVRLATIDTVNGVIGEVPSYRFLPLLSAAMAMAISDEVADLIKDAENIVRNEA